MNYRKGMLLRHRSQSCEVLLIVNVYRNDVNFNVCDVLFMNGRVVIEIETDFINRYWEEL